MPTRAHKILLVEPDPDVMEILVGILSKRLHAQLTCVATASACIDADLFEPHDLIISELDLDTDSGVNLARKIQVTEHKPVILLATDPDRDDLIEAMRVGVRDVYCKPFAVSDLVDAVAKLLGEHTKQQDDGERYTRMRSMVRRIIRERRELTQRMEFVCRDLVGAHRRLVHRVLEHQGVSEK